MRLIRQGLETQFQGWAMLESGCRNTPLHDLPGLMKKIQDEMVSKPAPATLPVPEAAEAEVKQEVKMEESGDMQPIPIKLAPNKYQYRCPACVPEYITATKNAMRGHINAQHLKQPLLCMVCNWSCFNPDRLAAHYKKKH